MNVNLRNWVRGYPKPMSFGAKASLSGVIGVFAPSSCPDAYGWGAVGVYIKAAESVTT
jgi:hypothetical protein